MSFNDRMHMGSHILERLNMIQTTLRSSMFGGRVSQMFIFSLGMINFHFGGVILTSFLMIDSSGWL